MDFEKEASLEVVQVHKGRRFRKGPKGKDDKRINVREFFGKTGQQDDFFFHQRRHDLYVKYATSFTKAAKAVDDHVLRVVVGKIVKRLVAVDVHGTNVQTVAIALGVLRNEERKVMTKLKVALEMQNFRTFMISSRSDVTKDMKNAVEPFLHRDKIEQQVQNSVGSASGIDANDSFEEEESVEAVRRFLDKEMSPRGQTPDPPEMDAEESSAERVKPYVFILEGLPEIAQDVLEGFIGDLAAIRKTHPVVLIIGIADASVGVAEYVPSAALNKLEISIVQSASPQAYRDALVEQTILYCRTPFFLGGKCVKMLHYAFSNVDKSVEAFKLRYLLCLFEHFYFHPESAFCDSGEEVEKFIRSGGKDGKKLENKDLALLRELTSFKEYEDEVKGRKGLLVDGLGETIARIVRDLPERMKEWTCIMRVVHAVGTMFPELKLPDSFVGFYSSAMEVDFVKTKKYDDLLEKLRECTKAEMIKAFSKALHKLEDVLGGHLTKKKPRTKRMDELFTFLRSALNDLQKSDSAPTESTSKPASPALDKNMSRAALKEALKKNVEEERARRKPDEALRRRILEEFDALLVLHDHPSNYIWHEVFFFDDYETVQNFIFGYAEDSVQCALSDPALELACDCCEATENGATLPNMPDICIAYRLLSEHENTKVSLRDWLYQFDAILVAGQDVDEDAEPSVDVQARFVEAVGELHLLGLIKPVASPQDHVEKLF